MVRRRLPQLVRLSGLVWLSVLLGTEPSRAQTTFIVDSTGDGGASGSTSDGVCDAQPGLGEVCTLRAAIAEANGTPGADIIHFSIGGGGLQTISPGSAYPTISETVTIDGTSQPLYPGTPIIEIDGSGAGGANAFTLGAGSNGSTIRGLVIGQFGPGIAIRIIGSSNNVIAGNYLGTDSTGTIARPNAVGVFIQNGTNNLVGGAVATDRNVISGNSPDGIQIEGTGTSANIVRGNYIGVDASGTNGLGNTAQGIAIFGGTDNNVIGGTTANERNVISGNGNNGVGIGGSGTTGNVVQGNYIGTDAAGTAAIGNLFGVALEFSTSNNTIGDPTAGNVISGNVSLGILIDGSANNTVQGNFIGTDSSGNADVGNGQHGIQILGGSTNNLIGGASGDGNVISGNNLNGIDILQISTTGNRIAGNIIGLDAAGGADLGNTDFGVAVAQGASGNIIGEVGGGNVISGNDKAGVRIVDPATNNNLVQLNYIGLDITGTLAFPNSAEGVVLDAGGAATGNTIGGAGLGNVISGNSGPGIRIRNSMTATTVADNIIGRDAADSAPVPNGGGGVRIESSSGNTIGGTGANDGNVIARNNADGVAIIGAASGNRILGNAIFSNAGLGIDLGGGGVTPNDVGDGDSGENNWQNYPVLSGATTTGAGNVHIAGSLNSAGSLTYRVEFFASAAGDPSGFGEGARYLGFADVTTDGSGNAVFGVTLGVVVTAGEVVTATATDPGNNTSEFSATVTAVGDLVVTTTDDTVDGTVTSVAALIADPGTDDRISLREAIRATNATGGADTIRFGIPLTDSRHFYYQEDFTASSLSAVTTTLADADIGDFDTEYPPGLARSWYRIEPTSSLPTISDELVIDATTQPGAVTNGPVVELAGTNAGATGRGFRIGSAPPSVTIRGFIINEFGEEGITSAAPTTVQGCYIGTDPSGTLARGNGIGGNGAGIYLGGDGSQVGGLALAERNVLSGNVTNALWIDADNILVQGNYIGTDVTGTADVGNGMSGVVLQTVVSPTVTNVTIGGTAAGSRNVISGNDIHGVQLFGAGVQNNVIEGNYIGTDFNGTAAIPNATDGVRFESSASFNTLGGTAAGAGNVISGNGDDGIFLGPGTTDNVIQGNHIGTDVSGTLPLGNVTHGVSLGDVANTMIGGAAAGARNVIAHNGARGIRTAATTLSGNSFLRNAIHTNGGLGIDLGSDGVTNNDIDDVDNGPNDLLNWPVIYQVTESGGTLTVDVTLDVPAGSYRLEFFRNPSGADGSGYGEGELFAGSKNVTHAGAGFESFSHSFAGVAGDVVTATTTFCTDGVTCAAFGSTSEFSEAFVEGVTAVELTSFTATARDEAVELEWQTASEIDNLGFHLYRSTAGARAYERLTLRAIPGLGSSPTGATYSYRDEGLTNGVTYHYQLEDIDASGKTTLHGPVSATPKEGAGDEEKDDSSGRPRITVGDPEASFLKVLRRSHREVVLILDTGGFYAEPREDGSVVLTIPGFDALTEPNAPEVPVRRSWVEAVAGRRVELVSVTPRRIDSFQLRPSDAGAPEIEVDASGTVRAARKRARRRDFLRDGLYPLEPARLVSVGFQSEVKKALVELAPLRFDETNGRLFLARRLVVRLAFRGRDPSESTSDGVRGKRGRVVRTPSGRVAARLVTKEQGLYAVSFKDVFGGRRRPLPASNLRLSRGGEVVAYHLEPHPDRFGRGSTLYFVSNGASANPYGLEAVYELELGDGGVRMPVIDASPEGDTLHHYRHTVRLEQNRYYQPALVDAPDRWLWELILAPDTKSFSFSVDALATTAAPSRVRLWLQGASDLRETPDHHVRVYVNGVLVGESSWDGKETRALDVEVPPGVIVEGHNTLAMENVGDTAASQSMVMLDRFEVVYPRLSVAVDGRLEGRWSASGVAEISGLGETSLWLDTTEELPRWLHRARGGHEGIARARVDGGRRYLVVHRGAVLQPKIRKPARIRLARKRHRAEYLVIAPEAYLSAAAPLVELRRRQGLRTKTVSMESIYSEFGFGETNPEALREFLSYAYHRWKVPPRYVVLLGDATYDFKNYLETGVHNDVPPLIVKTRYLWTASDPSFAAVNGDDVLPDIALGRLPASSVAEAQRMVNKIVAYETGDAGLSSAAVVLVADNPDPAGNFEADADALASSILAERDVRKVYLSRLGVSASRDAIVHAFDEGASLMSYVGHGGIHLWASENLFDLSAVRSLSPQSRQPVVLTMNCLNGYFHFPYFNSLAEELLQAEDKGAIAAFSPSGLSLNGPAHVYHAALLEQLLHGTHPRLGDAVMAAQENYADSGAFPELLSLYHLFGDPALSLR